MNKEVIEATSIRTIKDNKNDDIFICAGSPEIRCLGAVKKLDKDYRAENIFILKYSHYNEKRENHLKEMRAILKERKVGRIDEFLIDEESPLLILNDVVQKIEKYIVKSTHPGITIDISTLIKWHLLILLKALDVKGLLNKCRFLYTEPKDYLTDLFQPLSFGLKQIFPIPLFSGNYDFSKDSLLIIMLGYEGDRAMALLENIDPAECLLLVPKPAYHPEWEGRTEKMNKEIINIVGESNIRYIDSRNPMLVSQQLNNILTDKYSSYNCIISPMGTKPQTVGLYLFSSKYKDDISLIYTSPLRHNDPFYSEGIGETWIMTFTD